jgi:hypothetical protein
MHATTRCGFSTVTSVPVLSVNVTAPPSFCVSICEAGVVLCALELLALEPPAQPTSEKARAPAHAAAMPVRATVLGQ